MKTHKVCTRCKISKEVVKDFYFSAGFYRSNCKPCSIKVNNIYQRRRNKLRKELGITEDYDSRREYMKAYYRKNKEKVAEYKRKFKEKNPGYYNEYYRKRRDEGTLPRQKKGTNPDR